MLPPLATLLVVPLGLHSEMPLGVRLHLGLLIKAPSLRALSDLKAAMP